MLTSQWTRGRLMNGVLFSEVHLFLINLFCGTMGKMLVRYSTYDLIIVGLVKWNVRGLWPPSFLLLLRDGRPLDRVRVTFFCSTIDT